MLPHQFTTQKQFDSYLKCLRNIKHNSLVYVSCFSSIKEAALNSDLFNICSVVDIIPKYNLRGYAFDRAIILKFPLKYKKVRGVINAFPLQSMGFELGNLIKLKVPDRTPDCYYGLIHSHTLVVKIVNAPDKNCHP